MNEKQKAIIKIAQIKGEINLHNHIKECLQKEIEFNKAKTIANLDLINYENEVIEELENSIIQIEKEMNE